jgi:hypothetical protein
VAITRIERLLFGVADIDDCVRFHTDAGLELRESRPGLAVLATAENQTVVLKRQDDPSLPRALEAGPTLRELVWGVDDAASLEALVADLRSDRAVTIDAEGVAHTHDETGLALGLMVSRPAVVPQTPPRPGNSGRTTGRWNDPVPPPGSPRPTRIAHLAYNIPRAGHEAAIAFYVERLGFRPTDVILDTGTFMRCEGDVEHHNFFLCHRPDQAGFNHFALEMCDLDALIAAGNHMIDRRWRESRVLGRHRLGSNLYRFFVSPAGGRLEFEHDMDRLDERFQTRVWETNPGHHLWSIKSSGVSAE